MRLSSICYLYRIINELFFYYSAMLAVYCSGKCDDNAAYAR